MQIYAICIFLAIIFVHTVLTDLLDTPCQYLYPIVNITMSCNFKHCHMCTLHDFYCSKARFIYTSTVTGSLSCSGKNYAYASRTFCYNLFSFQVYYFKHHNMFD